MSARRGATPTRASVAMATEQRGLTRIEFFSDAVFAIAITLLVLDVTLPVGTTKDNLSQQLAAIWPRYGAFTFTFLVIGLRWLTHHLQFRFIDRYDYTILALNMGLLLTVAFLPFPSRVLAEYPDARSASILYAATVAMAGLLSSAIWIYARARNLLDGTLSRAESLRLSVRWIVLPLLFCVSIVLALVTTNLWAARAVALATPLVQLVIASRWPVTLPAA